MKKTLALILAIVMVFALATTAFAAEDIVGWYNNANYEGINKGATDFDSGNPSTTIAITATQGNVEHRYAVDIEFGTMEFSIAGDKLVWNVSTLKYESKDPNAPGLDDKTFPVTIKNYSDVDVYLNTAVTDEDDQDGVLVTTNVTENTTVTSAISGSVIPCEFTVTVQDNGKTWDEIASYYTAKFAADPQAANFLVATLTVTVSKAPLQTQP